VAVQAATGVRGEQWRQVLGARLARAPEAQAFGRGAMRLAHAPHSVPELLLPADDCCCISSSPTNANVLPV
jgi:hypothetical protein